MGQAVNADKDMLRARVAAYIKRAQAASGLTPQGFAAKVGMRYSSYTNAISQRRIPCIEKMLKMQEASGLSLDEIDERIWRGIDVIRDIAQAVNSGVTVNRMIVILRSSYTVIHNCVDFYTGIDGGEAPKDAVISLETVIRFADTVAAMGEAKWKKLAAKGGIGGDEVRRWMELSFCREIAKTMRLNKDGEYEFQSLMGTYKFRIIPQGEKMRFQAWFCKNGAETLSSERWVLPR